jgi:4-amino-4-deoxy-L-arabinose transferase-like glycosyltransferase
VERRVVQVILVTAITMRVAAVAGLFLVSSRFNVPFATFFGDEEFFIRRSIWLRNLALGVPVHGADLIYAFDAVGQTSYLYILAFIQVLVGPSPYGVHLVAIAFYISAGVLLYRLVRSTLGRAPAIIGLVLLLCLPSLLAWSISALKEPFYFFVTTITILLVVKMARSPRWAGRVVALAAILVLIGVAEGVRREGGTLAAISLTSGLALAALVVRPRLLTVVLVAAPIALGAALSRPEIQMKADLVIRQAARQHAGHINTTGYVYKTLEERFYQSSEDLDDIRGDEAGRFLVRSLVSYVTVPLPWDVQSRAALAYVPEQIIWYLLVALLPAGLVFSFRRDALVTALLIANAVASSLLVAITSGNVGTLVRHRGMAIPYIVWLSAVGGCELVCRIAAAARLRDPAAPLMARMEQRCP